MPRLVIPAGQTGSDKAPWGPTWTEVAAEAKVDIAVFGDQWCTDNRVNGLGIASDYVAPLPVVPPGPDWGDTLLDALDAVQTMDDVAEAAAAAKAAKAGTL